jgi:hypothetical protein
MRKAILMIALAFTATIAAVLGNSPPMKTPTPTEKISVGIPTFEQMSFYIAPQQAQQPSAQEFMPMLATLIVLLGAASMLPKIVVITKQIRRFWRGLPTLEKSERSFVLG